MTKKRITIAITLIAVITMLFILLLNKDDDKLNKEPAETVSTIQSPENVYLIFPEYRNINTII